MDVRDSSDVIMQRDVDVDATYDPVYLQESAIQCLWKLLDRDPQSRSLEEIVIPLFDFCIIVRVSLLRYIESVAIIYSRDVLSNIVVESRVHHQHHAYPGGLSQQSLFSEGVGLQQTIFECSDRVLSLLISTI